MQRYIAKRLLQNSTKSVMGPQLRMFSAQEPKKDETSGQEDKTEKQPQDEEPKQNKQAPPKPNTMLPMLGGIAIVVGGSFWAIGGGENPNEQA